MDQVQYPGSGIAIEKLAIAFGNMVISPAGLAQGTAVNTSIKAANQTNYICGGSFATPKAAFEVAFPVSGNSSFTGANDVTPNVSTAQERVYAVSLNAAGTPTVTAGVQATGAGNALLPERLVDGNTMIGYLRIGVAAGSTGFQANTTQPATSGAITATYKDGYPVPRDTTAQ